MTLADRVNELAKRDPEAAAIIREYERKLAEDMTCLQRAYARALERLRELDEVPP